MAVSGEIPRLKLMARVDDSPDENNYHVLMIKASHQVGGHWFWFNLGDGFHQIFV